MFSETVSEGRVNIIKSRFTHSGRLERWLGAEKVEEISHSMRNWYGPPIAVAGVPGSVWARKGGDFTGPIRAGQLCHAADYAAGRITRQMKRYARRQMSQCNAGFASLSDLIAEGTTGKARYFTFTKSGSTGVVGITNSLWRVAGQPAAGAAPAGAPGGTAFDQTSVGAFSFDNPTGGDTQHFVKGESLCGFAGNNLMLYDLIFGVAPTMNSTATEAVTGVPTRYQSTTPSAMNYAGGNFMFIQVGGTALPATAHNWTVCLYKNQAGTGGQTLPSVTGVSSAIVDRLDSAQAGWFHPLASGDTGIRSLEQMQCSALVATGVIWFMIGHPIAFMPMPIINNVCLTDGLMTAFNLVRIFDDACLTFLEVNKPLTNATTYNGMFMTVSG